MFQNAFKENIEFIYFLFFFLFLLVEIVYNIMKKSPINSPIGILFSRH